MSHLDKIQDNPRAQLTLEQLLGTATVSGPHSSEFAVQKLRETAISGITLSLLPFSVEDCAEIARLRNDPTARYFLNQDSPSTAESQLAWSKEYFKRTNDVLWVLKDKAGSTIGCNRVYDIDASSAEKGSLIIDRQASLRAPYVLEAELLAMTICFDFLRLDYITTTVRDDNQSMQSINSRFGFEKTDQVEIRVAQYSRYTLHKKVFNPTKFWSIVNHWASKI